MRAPELLSKLSSKGIRVWAEGDRLRFRAPEGALTPDLRDELVNRKAEILTLLHHADTGTGSAPVPMEPASRDGKLPLSFAQQRLWFLDRFEPDQSAYNVSWAARLTGTLEVSALEQALNAIVDRHEVLRTTYRTGGDGEPVQVIAPAGMVELEHVDLAGVAADERDAELQRQMGDRADRPFDLAAGPVLRATLFRLAPEDHALALTIHHIAFDGWSLGILAGELGAFYAALVEGAEPALPPLPIQYVDYAVWQRQWLQDEVLEEQLDYWRRRLGQDLPVLALPTDHPRPAVQTFAGARESYALSESLLTALRSLSQRGGATLYMTLTAGLKALFHRYTGQSVITIGTPVANRTRSELEPLIGFFVNSLVLSTELDGNLSFREVLARVRETSLGAFAHQDLPFEQLVEAVKPERDQSRHPLFQVMFALQNASSEGMELPGLRLNALPVERSTSQFDLVLSAQERDGELRLYAAFNTDLFERETIRQLLRRYERLLTNAVEDPDRAISRLSLLDEDERRQLLVDWNATASTYPRDATLAERFAAQAAATPDAAALVFEGQRLSYSELNDRADRLAAWLQQEHGVSPEVRVGLYLPRSVEMIVGVLGITNAGGAYVPLDANAPLERLAFILEDAAVAVVLTLDDQRGGLPAEWSGPVIALDGDWSTIGAAPAEPLETGATAESLAYIMYTSGSTGVPKGTSICQRSVLRLVLNTDYLEFGPEETFLQFGPLAFDASTLEIWGSLLHGSKLVVYPPKQASLKELARCLEEHQVSTLWLTAAIFHQMVDSHPGALRGVRQLLAGGDVLSVPHVRKVLGNLSDSAVLINGYGPTENTTFTCCHVMTGESEVEGSVPIGRPIANTRVYVLDASMQPVPVGVYGEMYVGGDGLARDYLKRPALTAEKFVPDPFSEVPGSRLYRTGDMGRYRPDGTIEFQGRRDHQVKLRGYRIELGEVEAVLGQHGGVGSCVALAREDEPGDKRLVGYVVPTEDSLTASELRQHLQERLPDYMVPAHFVMLDALPVTPNGKVDRKALPAPELSREELVVEFVPPRDPVEKALARIWGAVLAVECVGVRDNFFELGGHSLLATQVVARIGDELGVEVPLLALFEEPTIEELACRVATLDTDGQRLEVRSPVSTSRDRPLQLSFAQQRLWFLNQLDPDQTAFNMAWAFRLAGDLDVDALEQALSTIVDRHEVLRTTFAAPHDSDPIQIIAPAAAVELERVDLTSLPRPKRDAELQRQMSERADRAFDLGTGPLLRATLYRLASEEHALALTIHHIAFDGWSFGILARELGSLYAAIADGREPTLPALPIQYADYAAWQRQWLQGEVLETQIDYWREQLGPELPVLELPTDHPRPAQQSYRGGRENYAFPKSLLTSLKSLSQQEGVTLFMTLITGLKILFHRYSGQSVVTIGTPVANRIRSELEPLIGFFVNSLVLSTELEGELSFRDVLARVREASLGAYAHQDLPFERLVELLSPERDPSRHPLFQVMFALQNIPFQPMDLPGLTLSAMPVDKSDSKLDLTVFAREFGGELRLFAIYNTDLFEPESIRRLFRQFETVLVRAVADPDQAISRLPLSSETEGRQYLVEWNDTATDYSPDRTLVGLFEDQVQCSPERVALVFGDQALTYDELNYRANRLAHHLQDLGVGPEVLVGVFIERSIDAVVSLLATLKAGGAYLPLDPEQPAERISLMIGAARPAIVLAEEKNRSKLPDGQPVLVLDEDRTFFPGESDANPEPRAGPGNLAYVIFTSGSTGRPKGVAVEHRQIQNYVQGMLEQFDLPADSSFAMVSPLTADLGLTMLFPALCSGGSLHLIPDDSVLDPSALGAYFRQHKPDCLKIVPSHLASLLMSPAPADILPEKYLVLGGEACPWRLIDTVQELKPGCRVVNHYGPTETTVGVTTHRVANRDCETGRTPSVPIGRPLPNSQAYILDSDYKAVPPGIAGELYIGGRGVARGYAASPDLTAERFVPHPYAGEPGARLYRTGDRARFRADGTIEFLGRVDHQVKLRGFRIELGEIEAALSHHDQVHAAVVALREKEGGESQLVAYVVPALEQVSGSDLRQSLRQALPEYMVPSAFVKLEALPLLPNGKVDRRRLPEPDPSQLGPTDDFVAPRNLEEATLAEIWEDLLGLDQAGVNDNFFELGGHSLLATQAMSRIRRAFDVDVPLRAFFDSPTIAGIAAALAAARWGSEQSARTEIVRIARERVFPLSFTQERFWLLDQIHGDRKVYHTQVGYRIKGPLDVGIFRQSIQALVDRHEILRTTFPDQGGTPSQVVHPRLPVDVPLRDCSALSEEYLDEIIEEVLQEEKRHHFDLARGPLFRARLVRFADDDHFLVLDVHHIIHDAWSLVVITKDLIAAYKAGCEGHNVDLPALPVQYVDFAHWQRKLVEGQSGRAQLAFWQKQLAHLPPPLALPTDRPRGLAQTFRGAKEFVRLPSGCIPPLRALNRQEGTSFFMVMLAAFQMLLHRLTGTHDIVVGSPTAGRDREETHGMVGCFLNTLVLRTDLSGDPTGRELLQRVRAVVLDAHENQDVPFEKILQEVELVRDPSRTPVFQVMLNMHSFDDRPMQFPDLAFTRVPAGIDKSLFDMTLYFEESVSEIKAQLTYATDLFTADRARSFLQQLNRVLEQLANEPDRPISEYSLLTEASRTDLPDPRTALATPPQTRVTDLIARWAQDAPDGVAVRQGSRQWSYGELATQAEKLGRSLEDSGLGAGTVVAVSGQPSFGLIVAMLGALQCGGVLLMVDPVLPDARKSLMLDEANVRVLILVGDDDAKATWADSGRLVRVGLSPETGAIYPGSLSPQSIEPSEPAGSGEDPAYVFFTSGTTGHPKGIVGSHGSLSHFLTWQRDTFGVTPADRVAQLTGLSFDVVLRDIFLPLISGASLCIPEDADRVDGERVLRWMDRERVTLLHSVPAVATAWLASVPDDVSLSDLRLVFFAGEPLTDQLVRKWRTAFPGRGKMVNLYGTTETTLAKCFYSVPEDPVAGVQPIGGPLPDTQVLIMTTDRRMCGIGELGEIVIRTPFRTLGPLPGQAATGSFFHDNPYRPGARGDLYFSGDLGRYRPDGTVEILGRIDEQVKIRGVRIEPNEVTSALATHPSVHACFVMAQKGDTDSAALVAYVVPAGDTPPTNSDLRAYVARQLPAAMVPGSFVFLDALPYTPNGKIDRRALPRPVADQQGTAVAFVAPQTPTEEHLARIWREVMGIDRVGVHDDFFELGGHSLLATQVISRVCDQFEVALPLLRLFEAPTIAGLSELIETMLLTDREAPAQGATAMDDLEEGEL